MSQNSALESSYALEARELSVILGGQKVLEVPNLHVIPNEVLVVIGPNGSGKTTLLLCLASLLKPATGAIFYRGQLVGNGAGLLDLRRRFAVVFQEPLLLNATVWENVALGLRLRGMHKEKINQRARRWLERFGVASLAKRQARMLSGGEAKRVSLARAFALEPEVLFLDEPFTALDSPTRQTLIEDFEGVLRETKVTTLMVTHDRNEAVVLANRVAVLMGGRIRQIGEPEIVFSYPADEEVASFVEAGNVMYGAVSSQNSGLASVTIADRTIYVVSALSVGSRVTVFLRQEDITISLPLPQNPSSSARNNLMGKVARVFPQGSQIRVTVDVGFLVVSLITRRSYEELVLGTGKEVMVSFKASSVHLMHRM